jgi:hypothetical protein
MEAFFAKERDHKQRHELIAEQMKERRVLQQEIRNVRGSAQLDQSQLHKDLASYRRMQMKKDSKIKEHFNDRSGVDLPNKNMTVHPPTHER